MLDGIVLSCVLIVSTSDASRIGQHVVENRTKTDKQLVAKIKEAIERKISARRIEKYVGQTATISTSRPDDKFIWGAFKLDLDVKNSQIKTFRGATHVVYWVRNIKTADPGSDPQIVGVVWTRPNEMKLFFGSVPAP
jgi:t-SNARE complex subunit (syntaxin)